MVNVIYDVYPIPKITGNYYKASDIRKIVGQGDLVLVCSGTELSVMDLSRARKEKAEIVSSWKAVKDSVRAAVTDYEKKGAWCTGKPKCIST